MGREYNKHHLDAELPLVVQPDPEGPIDDSKKVGVRFSHLFVPAWPGSPLAMIMRRSSIHDVLNDIAKLAHSESVPDDVTLTMIAGDRDFLQIEPVLCHEREQGGTTTFQNGQQHEEIDFQNGPQDGEIDLQKGLQDGEIDFQKGQEGSIIEDKKTVLILAFLIVIALLLLIALLS